MREIINNNKGDLSHDISGDINKRFSIAIIDNDGMDVLMTLNTNNNNNNDL